MSKNTRKTNQIIPVVSDLEKFLSYNLFGALLPLIISWGVRQLSGVAATEGVYAAELLFFAVMISTTALGDLSDETKHLAKTLFYELIKGGLRFGALGVAAIFGAYQYDSIFSPSGSAFRQNITTFSLYVAIALFVLSLVAEIMVVRIRNTR